MRFSTDRPDFDALRAQMALEGPMQNCPDCGAPVTRERAMEIDRAWKRHYEHCEPHQTRVAIEEGTWTPPLADGQVFYNEAAGEILGAEWFENWRGCRERDESAPAIERLSDRCIRVHWHDEPVGRYVLCDNDTLQPIR